MLGSGSQTLIHSPQLVSGQRKERQDNSEGGSREVWLRGSGEVYGGVARGAEGVSGRVVKEGELLCRCG